MADQIVACTVVDADPGHQHAGDGVVLDRDVLRPVPELDALAAVGLRGKAAGHGVDVVVNVVAADHRVRGDVRHVVGATAPDVSVVRERELVVDEEHLLDVRSGRGGDESVAEGGAVTLDVRDVVVRDGCGAVDKDPDALAPARIGAVGVRADEVAADHGLPGGCGDRVGDFDLGLEGAGSEAVEREVLDNHVAGVDDEARSRERVHTRELELGPVDERKVELVARACHAVGAGADFPAGANLSGVRIENGHAVRAAVGRAVDRRAGPGDRGQQAGDADRPPVAAASGLVRRHRGNEAHCVGPGDRVGIQDELVQRALLEPGVEAIVVDAVAAHVRDNVEAERGVDAGRIASSERDARDVVGVRKRRGRVGRVVRGGGTAAAEVGARGAEHPARGKRAANAVSLLRPRGSGRGTG